MDLMTPLRRIVYSSFGRKFIQYSRQALKPVFLVAGMQRLAGHQLLDPSKRTVLVVSHEASATGAPILALNICEELSKEYNIVVIMLRGGQLLAEFQGCAVEILRPRIGTVFSLLVNRELKRLLGGQKPYYAVVNSVVSARCIQPLRALGIPTLTLIHEFAAYIRPIGQLNNVGIWSSCMVFSSELTRDDILSKAPQLEGANISVLPQGPCQLPLSSKGLSDEASHADGTVQFLKELDPDATLVIGAGAIQPRKGVDLFIAVADQLRQKCKGENLQFAWIGSGYDPIHDFGVSLWLEDQIQRSGLLGKMHILDHSPAYEELLKRTDIFLMTSRLDPLPNVAIDALLAEKPMLCFSRACGIANMIRMDEQLYSALVAPYLNVESMAEQASALVRSAEFRHLIAKRCREKAETWFDMPSYIQSLKELGEKIFVEEKILEEELEILLKSDAISTEFAFSPGIQSRRNATKHYLLAWRNNIWPRKPFPGFHPGIYRELQLNNCNEHDPLVHYLESGKPEGSWKKDLIIPGSKGFEEHEPKTALHIHVHYPELLPELLQALKFNKIRPDLFVSCSANTNIEQIKQEVLSRGFVLNRFVRTPNRGRDIGPLISELGQDLDRNYDYHGHIHTKKSELIGGRNANQWRQFLIAHLLGSADNAMADSIINAMENNLQLGLIFPDDPTCVGWCGNREAAEELAKKLGLGALPAAIDFPVGTMFWARKGALKPLYDLELKWVDYPPEPLGYDGTMLHAIERLLPLIAQSQGYSYGLSHVKGVSR